MHFSRIKQAFKLLAYIPYELIVIDSEVAETSGTDDVCSLQNAREWLTVKLVFITNSACSMIGGIAACSFYKFQSGHFTAGAKQFIKRPRIRSVDNF